MRLTLLALALVAGTASATPPPVQAWLTTPDQKALLTPTSVQAAQAKAPVIELLPQEKHQQMVGFGAAITEASAWVLDHRMTAAQRDKLLRELFTREQGGLGFEFTRLTIGASDFSREHYSLDDMPPGGSDLALEHFSIAPEEADVLPVTREVLKLNPQLKVMASPWSAPAWMKSGDSLIQGTLRDDRQDVFARYLVRYAEEVKRLGVPLFALTLQNEPHFEPGDYPGMRLRPRQRAEVIKRLGPMLESKGLSVKIFDWDHNWDEAYSPLATLADEGARKYIGGVAWHCYAGDPAGQDIVTAQYPKLDAWLTECSGGAWEKDWRTRLPWAAHHLVIGATRHGARGVLMWNLVLDENFGPHKGGCTDCYGIVNLQADGSLMRSVEYYAFGHVSRFVVQGARRIGSETRGGEAVGLEHVAFQNPDGSLVLVVGNTGKTEQAFNVRGRSFTLPAGGLVTLVYSKG
jgi:glucosylceramidase